MSIAVMTDVWRDKTITDSTDLLVLLSLADFANNEGRCWPGVETLSERTRLCDRSIRRSMGRLKKSGKLEVRKNAGPFGCNIYIIKAEGGGRTLSPGGRTLGQEDLKSPDPSLDICTSTKVHVPGGGTGEPVSKPLSKQAQEVYEAYPRKIGRPRALAAITRAIKKFGYSDILSKTKAYATARRGQDQTFTPHPSTWFTQERFNDDPSTWVNKPRGLPPRNFAEEQGRVV